MIASSSRHEQLAKRIRAAHAQGLLRLTSLEGALAVAIAFDDELSGTGLPFDGFRLVDWLIECPEVERVDADDATLGALLLP